MTMNDSRRRLIIEYMGEPLHEWELCTPSDDHVGTNKCSCGFSSWHSAVESHIVHSNNRTFTTPADFFALFRKMVEKGDWHEFYIDTYMKWFDKKLLIVRRSEFTAHLLSDIERFCDLVGEWLEGKERFCSLVREWLETRQKGE